MIAKNTIEFEVLILLLSLIFITCDCYSGIIPPDPENPGKCFYHDEPLKLGVNIGPGPCQRLTCKEDGSVLVEGCGKVRMENCNRGERINSEKPYPECCKLRYKCKRPDGSSYLVENDVVS